MIERTASRSRSVSIGLLLTGVWLCAACSDDQGISSADAHDSGIVSEQEVADRYREEVKQRVAGSIVRSFAREWQVAEETVECVLADLEVTRLDKAESDPEVAAVFVRCGVDPAAVK